MCVRFVYRYSLCLHLSDHDLHIRHKWINLGYLMMSIHLSNSPRKRTDLLLIPNEINITFWWFIGLGKEAPEDKCNLRTVPTWPLLCSLVSFIALLPSATTGRILRPFGNWKFTRKSSNREPHRKVMITGIYSGPAAYNASLPVNVDWMQPLCLELTNAQEAAGCREQGMRFRVRPTGLDPPRPDPSCCLCCWAVCSTDFAMFCGLV